MKFDIFGIDRPCVDFTVDLNTIPARNTGCLLNGTGWQGGGKVSTGVVAAARLGVACTLVGCVGDDLYGRFFRDDFVRHSVDVSQLHLAADYTSDLGVVVGERSSATRTILYRKGTAPMLAEEQVDWQALKKSQYLYIAQTTGLNAAAMDRASAWNIPIFIDADYYSDSLAESIPRTSYFVASEFVFDAMFPGKGTKELREMEPECREILRQGPRTVVFTFGGPGCVGCSREDGFARIPGTCPGYGGRQRCVPRGIPGNAARGHAPPGMRPPGQWDLGDQVYVPRRQGRDPYGGDFKPLPGNRRNTG